VRARLPARYAHVATGFFLTLMMTCIISGVSTLMALGPGLDFLKAWPPAWGISWVIAFPTVLVVLPLVRRIVGRLVAPA
jgi:hypothetical protein